MHINHCFCAESPFLLYANRDDEAQGITMTNLDGSNSKIIITNMTASGLDYDYKLVALAINSYLAGIQVAVQVHACVNNYSC